MQDTQYLVTETWEVVREFLVDAPTGHLALKKLDSLSAEEKEAANNGEAVWERVGLAATTAKK